MAKPVVKKKLIPQVRQEIEKEVPVEVLAEAIKSISAGVRKLREGPLTDRALYLLIQNNTSVPNGHQARKKVGITEIKAVIEGMETLEREYLKP